MLAGSGCSRPRSLPPSPPARRAGPKAGQQRAGAGNCAPSDGRHGRAGGRARKQRPVGLRGQSSIGSQSKGQLSCCDVRAVSHLSIVQDLRDVARDRPFKHVFLGVVLHGFVTAGCCTFAARPTCTRSVERRSVLWRRTLGMKQDI